MFGWLHVDNNISCYHLVVQWGNFITNAQPMGGTESGPPQNFDWSQLFTWLCWWGRLLMWLDIAECSG